MVQVKICGITNLEDAQHAVDVDADVLGFIFYPESKRYLTANAAASIIRELPGSILKTGVFVNKSVGGIVDVARIAGLSVLRSIHSHGSHLPETGAEVP